MSVYVDLSPVIIPALSSHFDDSRPCMVNKLKLKALSRSYILDKVLELGDIAFQNFTVENSDLPTTTRSVAYR